MFENNDLIEYIHVSYNFFLGCKLSFSFSVLMINYKSLHGHTVPDPKILIL